jgi:hypothetical protein
LVNYIVVLDIVIWRSATIAKKGQELQASELVLSIDTIQEGEEGLPPYTSM